MSQSHLDRPDDLGMVHVQKSLHNDPIDVVNDYTMSVPEKRELLADWASDRRAVVNRPALRRLDSGKFVDIDAILYALKCLDKVDVAYVRRPAPHELQHDRLAQGNRVDWALWKDDDDDDPPPCPVAARPWKPRPPLNAAAEMMVA